MKKKGYVYRMTMATGLFILMAQIGGESIYSFFFKNLRNNQIKEEKKSDEKIGDFEKEDSESEESKKGVLKSREQYKTERLNRIKEIR